MGGRFDALVVGNVGVDTNVYLPGADIDWSAEANFTDNRDYVGQAGGYASRGYARLGWRTGFLGYAGADALGAFVRDELAGDGIDLAGLLPDPAGTSRSVNIMYRDGRRKNFYDGKSHMALAPDPALCRRLLAGTRLVHLNIPNWARTIPPLARELGAVVACDIQDVVALDDPYRQDFIAGADILFFSAANHPDPRPLIARLLERNPGQIVVAGMGAAGCAFGAGGEIGLLAPPALDLPVVDTNGAGDGLAVGFLASFVLERRPLRESLLRGQIAARHTCAQRASSSALISAAELDGYVAGLSASGSST